MDGNDVYLSLGLLESSYIWIVLEGWVGVCQ